MKSKIISAVTAMTLMLSLSSALMLTARAEEVIEINSPAELAEAATNGGSYSIADGVSELDCSGLTLTVRKSLSVDLNNAVLKNVPSNGFDIQGDMSVTLKNGTIEGTGNYAIKAMAKTPSDISLENIVTDGVKNGIACANAYSTVTITGGHIGGSTAGIACTMGHVNVTGAEIGALTLSNDSTAVLKDTSVETSGNGISAYGNASAEIDGCTVNGANYGLFWKSNGKLDVKGSNITSSTNGKGTVSFENTSAAVSVIDSDISNTNETAAKAYIITANSSDASNITINGGTYSGVIALNAAASTKLEIISGTFSSDPSKYLAADSRYEEDGGMFIVTSGSSAEPGTIDDSVYRVNDGVVSGGDVTDAPYWTFTKNFEGAGRTVSVGFGSGDDVKSASYDFGTTIADGSVTFSVFVTGDDLPDDLEACLIE